MWSSEYRRTGDKGGGWSGSFEDILAGIEHIAQLENYPINLGKIVLVDHSAVDIWHTAKFVRELILSKDYKNAQYQTVQKVT